MISNQALNRFLDNGGNLNMQFSSRLVQLFFKNFGERAYKMNFCMLVVVIATNMHFHEMFEAIEYHFREERMCFVLRDKWHKRSNKNIGIWLAVYAINNKVFV